MLGLTLQQLSKEVDISHEAINKIETGAVKNPRPKTIEVLVDYFDRNGIEFGKQSGVRFKSKQIMEISGKDCYLKLLDDVYHSVGVGDELLIACADDRVSPPAVNSAYRRIREKGVKMRQLIEEGNTYILGPLDEYKCLQKKHFNNNVIVVYNTKVGSVLDNENQILIIDDEGLARSVRNLFNVCWSSAPQPLESTANERF
jgi:transcriptional regulator with XRE-family HTH domain